MTDEYAFAGPAASPEDILNMLADEDFKADVLRLTEILDAHPEWWTHDCRCRECLSYCESGEASQDQVPVVQSD